MKIMEKKNNNGEPLYDSLQGGSLCLEMLPYLSLNLCCYCGVLRFEKQLNLCVNQDQRHRTLKICGSI